MDQVICVSSVALLDTNQLAKQTRLLPESLALYIAISACFSKLSTYVADDGYPAMPTLADLSTFYIDFAWLIWFGDDTKRPSRNSGCLLRPRIDRGYGKLVPAEPSGEI